RAMAAGSGLPRGAGWAVGCRAVPALHVADPAEVVQGGDLSGAVTGSPGGGQGVLVQGVGIAVVVANVQVTVQGGGLVSGGLGPLSGGCGGRREQGRLFV